MVKHSVSSMGRFFTRERFGRPQVVAGCLLLAFLLQCAWLVSRRAARVPAEEFVRATEGSGQWRGLHIAGTPHGNDQDDSDFYSQKSEGYDVHRSALWFLIASAPNATLAPVLHFDVFAIWGWLAAFPYLIFGTLLGASVWYVARRLYGNFGGYTALALYCFSPEVIRSSALWSRAGEIGAAWGAFGAVFTAIAVAHTLYAPREVVLWNWRRILLLAISLELAIGSQYSLLIVVPAALAFMLYLAPTRRLAAFAIWASACVLAFLFLYAAYFFHGRLFWQSLRHAEFLGIAWRAYAMPTAYGQLIAQLGQSSPALLLALPAAIATYIAWPRSRYFGNTAPLLMAVLFLLFALGTPHFPGLGFNLVAIPFLFVFIAGIAADLLETRYRPLIASCLLGLLVANALWNVWELARVGSS